MKPCIDKEYELSEEVTSLVSNGIDFLDKAVQELASGQVKFSVVSFWTAVEIMIKVPLVYEHWTLVCAGKKVVRHKYLAGDFQSVSYDDACTRLDEILEKPLSHSTKRAFDIVRKHRNRVVHFYHDGVKEADHKQVLYEQAEAWFALNRLMRDSWPHLFRPLLDRKYALSETSQLRNNKFYATAKFHHELVQVRLMQEQDAGNQVMLCPTCQQLAVVTDFPLEDMPLSDSHCLVCLRSEVFIEVSCPECGKKTIMEADGKDFVCSGCSLEKCRYDVIADKFISKHNMNDMTPAGCCECNSYDTVCDYADGYLCTSCFLLFESLQTCDYCNYSSTSVPDASMAFGCEFCDGHHDYRDD